MIGGIGDRRKRGDGVARRRAGVALVAYLLVPAVATLGPVPETLLRLATASAQRAVGSVTPEYQGYPTELQVEGMANVAMFVPIGFLLVLAIRRGPILPMLVAAMGAIAIEVVQAVALVERSPTARDAALNTAGATFGVLLAGFRDVVAGRSSPPTPARSVP